MFSVNIHASSGRARIEAAENGGTKWIKVSGIDQHDRGEVSIFIDESSAAKIRHCLDYLFPLVPLALSLICAECGAIAPNEVAHELARQPSGLVRNYYNANGGATWTRGVDGKVWCKACISMIQSDDNDGSLSRANRDLLGSSSEVKA